MRTKSMVCLVVSSFFLGVCFSMAAETGYPTKPIEVWVGYAPGGGTDLGVRMIAENSKKDLGQEMVVVNKPGGAGRVAATLISKAKPDGYTLGALTDEAIMWAPRLEKVAYKPLEDFTFIAQYGVLDFAISVLPNSPFQSLKDLIEFAKANPEKLTISTVGVGTVPYMALSGLSLVENIKIKLVPFNGVKATMTALLGGHVMAAGCAASGYAPYVKSGEVRLLAVMGEERLDIHPKVPTLKELGYPLITVQGMYIIVGPKNMDKPIVTKLSEIFKKAMGSPEYLKFAKELEIWEKNPPSGEALKERIIRREKAAKELMDKLGVGIKE